MADTTSNQDRGHMPDFGSMAAQTAGGMVGSALIPIPFVGGILGKMLAKYMYNKVHNRNQQPQSDGQQPDVSGSANGSPNDWMPSFGGSYNMANNWQNLQNNPSSFTSLTGLSDYGAPSPDNYINNLPIFKNHEALQEKRDNGGGYGSGNYGISPMMAGGQQVIFGARGDPNGRYRARMVDMGG